MDTSSSDHGGLTLRQRVLKRVFDIVIALVGLIATSWIILLAAAIAACETGERGFFTQQRVGRLGRPFRILKIRTMRSCSAITTVVTTAADPRITRSGRLFRKLKIDELPQLLNVLLGDMSFVGPRPERPYFVEHLATVIPFYMARHAVKPGVTGWAQVKYRYGASVEDALEKLRYDLYYIKSQSLIFDLTILIDTVKVILSGKGAQ